MLPPTLSKIGPGTGRGKQADSETSSFLAPYAKRDEASRAIIATVTSCRSLTRKPINNVSTESAPELLFTSTIRWRRKGRTLVWTAYTVA